jgi:hypothetical protein
LGHAESIPDSQRVATAFADVPCIQQPYACNVPPPVLSCHAECTGNPGPAPANSAFACPSPAAPGSVCNATCAGGYSGSPYATCQADGTYSAVTGGCLLIGKQAAAAATAGGQAGTHTGGREGTTPSEGSLQQLLQAHQPKLAQAHSTPVSARTLRPCNRGLSAAACCHPLLSLCRYWGQLDSHSRQPAAGSCMHLHGKNVSARIPDSSVSSTNTEHSCSGRRLSGRGFVPVVLAAGTAAGSQQSKHTGSECQGRPKEAAASNRKTCVHRPVLCAAQGQLAEGDVKEAQHVQSGAASWCGG